MSKEVTSKIVHIDVSRNVHFHIDINNEHGREFESQGIPKGYISYFVLNAVAEGNMVGYQGKGSHPREVYEYHYGGKKYLIAVTVGSNGYIVGANLTDESKIWRK